MSQHTPGPWKVRAASFADDGTPSWEVVGPTTINAADANLIGAAPDLLAALKRIIDGVDEFWMTENPGAVTFAEEAIRKAEGQP